VSIAPLAASVTLGSFLTKATMLQISWSGTSMAPKLGIPVMLFDLAQKNHSHTFTSYFVEGSK